MAARRGTRGARGFLAASRRNIILSALFSSIWTWSMLSAADECPGTIMDSTVLFLQKKGPEVAIQEVNITSGLDTGLRKSFLLHGAAIAGFAVDSQLQAAFVLPSSPPIRMEKYAFTSENQLEYVNSTTLRTSGNLGSDTLVHIWNVISWENRGHLLAAVPSDSGFNTSIVSVDTMTGMVSTQLSLAGAPIRGIFTFDRQRERYFFVTAERDQRNVVTFFAAEQRAEVSRFPSDAGFGELVGIHYDEVHCRMVGLFLRAPGVLSVKRLDLSQSIISSVEITALSPAVSLSVQANQLIGATALVNGVGGSEVLVRDPAMSLVTVFRLDSNNRYTIEIEDAGIVTFALRVNRVPRIESIVPSAAGMTGASRLTLTGSDFGLRDLTAVAYVGATAVSSVDWSSDTSLTVSPVASGIGGVGFPFRLDVYGSGAIPTTFSVEYVPSWTTVTPTEASVVGGTVLTFTGARFGAGAYECKFGNIQRVTATPSGSTTITCTVPSWPLPAGGVQLDILVDGAVMRRDTDGLYPLIAGDVTQLTVGIRPDVAQGGQFFDKPFQVLVRDAAGNVNLQYVGDIEVKLYSLSNGVASAVNMTDVSNPIQGPLLVGVSGGASSFSLSIARHGTYILSFFTSQCGCCLPHSTATGCFRLNATLEVEIGSIAALTVQTPDVALAGLPFIPQPVVQVRDSGGNIANVSVVVRALLSPPNPMAGLVASDVLSEEGVARFTDLQISANDTYTIVFSIASIASGPTINVTVQILHSRPRYLFNSGGRPTNMHVSMQPVDPPPTIWVLDMGGNRIVDTYWIQDQHGVRAERYLDVTVTAVLSTAFENLTTSFPGGYATSQLVPPYPLPSALPPPVSSNLFSTVSVRVRSDPSLQANCPTIEPEPCVPCPANASCSANATSCSVSNVTCSTNCTVSNETCSGHGSCSAAGTCNCSSEWQGGGCWIPSEKVLCGEACDSLLGRWEGGECGCFPTTATRFEVSQYGSAAVFDNLLIDVEATGYVMFFVSQGLEPARSFAFTVVSGRANHLWVLAEPMQSNGGEPFANMPVVEIRDAGRNLVEKASDGANVTVEVSLVDAPPTANLSGVFVRRAIDGHAIFSNLSVDLATVYAGGEYRLLFTADGLIEAYTQPFPVYIGEPFYFLVLTQPDVAIGGVPFGVQPVLELRDRGNNRVNASSGWSVNATLAQVGNASVTGTLDAEFVQGVATFTDLEVDVFGPHRIRFQVPTLADVLSDTFTVIIGSVSALFLDRQPERAIGGVLQVQPILFLVDEGGNLVVGDDRTISVQLIQGGDQGTAVSKGSYTTSNGFISFTDLSLTDSGNGYQFVFSSPLLDTLFSDRFNNTLGAPYLLGVSEEPGNVIAGLYFTRQPVVDILDQGNNFVPADGVNVSAQVNLANLVPLFAPFSTTLPEQNWNGSGCQLHIVSPDLFGTTNLLSTAGVVEFTDLTVNRAGSGYFLEFFSPTVQGTSSMNFTVSLGDLAVSLHVFCQPTVEFGGDIFVQQPVIDFLDSGGNRINDQTQQVQVELLDPNATLSGVLFSVSYGDLASFTNLAIDTAGDGYILRFESGTLALDETFAFSIVPGPAVAVNTNLVPNTVDAGEPQAMDVTVADKGGNVANTTGNDITAMLFEVFEETRTYRCTGTHSCDVTLNASIPSGARLMAAVLSTDILCTDLDFQTEQVTSVTVGSYPLTAGSEYSTGPWPGCFRSCSQSRSVINEFDLVRAVCWDSNEAACDRMLYTEVWNRNETRWDYLQTLTQQDISSVPLRIEISEDVNFHPCDGFLLSTDVSLVVKWALPASAGALAGNTVVATDQGVASFTDLVVFDANVAYTLGFFSPDLRPAYLNKLTVVPGPVRKLQISVQPGDGAGNSTLSPQPVVLLVDNGNNTVAGASGAIFTVSAELLIAENASEVPPSPLLGMSSLEADMGVAAFTDLFVGRQSDGFTYMLRFTVTVNGTDALDSQNFSVFVGPPYGMWVETQPDGVFGGDPFIVQPVVYAGDWSGNLVPSVSGVVSAAIGTNGGLTGVLSGQTTAVLMGDKTTFVNLTLDRAGQGYSLIFSIDGLVSGETLPFTVQKGNATQLAMRREPSGGIVMRLLGIQPAVEVHDKGGNKISDWTGTITVSIGLEGSAIHPTLATNISATLIGTTNGLIFNGAGYFWNLRLDKMGLGFVLTFSAGDGIRDVNSTGFNIFGDTATSLRVLVQPSIARTTLRMPEIVVAAQDDNGDIDGAFAVPASADLMAVDGSAVPQVYNSSSIAFANGLAIFDSVQVAESAGQLQMNFSADGLSVVSDVFDVIEAFTGWWDLTYEGDHVQLAMSRDPWSRKVSATWSDAATSADVSYAATHDPEIDVENACMTVAGAAYSAGRGMSSAYFEHCERELMTGLSADLVATELETATLYGKDVQHLVIVENYPTTETVHYILVANAFNSTSSSYTLDSALYKWDSGTFNLHQTFPSTKGATSWEYFQMGGSNYLIVANHFDDTGNGYGTPSIIYQQEWDQGEGKLIFNPIQSVSGSGAVVWRHFVIDEFDYLAVANYFNGSDFDINSKVYKLERTNPDTLVPRTTPIQSIPTSGARDLVHFAIGSMDYIAFANRWGGSVAIYRWSSTSEQFVHFQEINTTAPMGVDAFVIDGVQYLAIANLARENSVETSSNSSIHVFDASAGFVFYQDLPTQGASFIRAVYNDDEQLLTLANVHDVSVTNGTCDVYKWDGSKFRPYLELPTTHAHALTVLTAPCATNNPGGPLCDRAASERMVIAVNGIGSGSEVFRFSSLNATTFATHLQMESISSGVSFSDTQVGVTITPDVVARLMRFTEWVTEVVGFIGISSADGLFATQKILADAVVSSFNAPTGITGPKVAPVLNENLQFVTVAGEATFGNISATSSGNSSIRASNAYLNDVAMARTNEFFVAPGAAHQLQLQDHGSVFLSGSILSVLVSVHDSFGNLLADASGTTITARPFGNSTITLSSDTSLTTVNGVASFNIQIDGNDRGASIIFESSGLQSVVSADFDVIATTAATTLPSSDLIFGGATITKVGDFVFLFGGVNVSEPTAAVVQLQTTVFPYSFQEVAVTGIVPAGRYRHVSVGVELNGVPALFVHGGTNGSSLFSDSFVLSSNTLVWSAVQTNSPAARQRHGATAGSILQDGTSNVISLVAVFGGMDEAGNALAALELYRVFLYNVQQAATIVQTGTIPSARYDFVMAWTSGKGYVLGGEGIDASLLYSFEVSYDGSHYFVHWTTSVPDAGTVPAPYRSLTTTPAYFDSKVYLFATTSAADTSGTFFGLDVDAYPSPLWLETSSPGLPAGGIYQFVEVAEGKFIVLQSDFTNLTSSSRRLLQSSSFSPFVFQLSLVGSERLLLVSSTNPTSGSAGLELTPQPLVNVVDSGGNTVTGVGSFASIFATAFDFAGDAVTLGGTSSIEAQNGVAQFTDLSVDTNTSGVVLRFSSPALFPVDSAPFTVVRGPAAILIMTTQPFGVFLGQTFFVQPVVELQDTSGNKVIEDSFSIVTAKLQRSAASGFVDSSLLIGDLGIRLARGSAEYTDLAIDSSATVGINYRIVVSRAGVISAISNVFTFTDAAGTEVNFDPAFSPNTGQCVNQSEADSSGCSPYSAAAAASNTGLAMVPFASQPQFTIVVSDTALNYRHDPGLIFTASLITTTNETALPNSFYGNTSAEASDGVVKFTDLGIKRVGSNFKIRFESAGFPILDSTAFTIIPGTPSRVLIVQDTVNSGAGLALLQQPAVSVSDAGHNLVSIESRVVATLLKGAVVRKLDGDLEARTTNGIATFTDLAVDAAENDFVLRFSVAESCCGDVLSVSGHEFNVTVSKPSQLSELVVPAGGTGGVAFTTQPQVGVLDAGGNLITSENGTEVKAYLFKDQTMHLAVKQSVSINGFDIVDLEHFVVNGSDYIVAAMFYDETTYELNSFLYRWDPEQEVLVQIQTIPTNGATAWKHVEFEGDHFLFLANSFEEVSVISGVILGTYITDSKIFQFVNEQLVFREEFQTEGAEDIESFSVGGQTFIAVANNFNDTSTDIESVLYSFNGSATPRLTPIQALPTEAANIVHAFTSSAGTFLALGMLYSEAATSYVTTSNLYRFIAGELELLTTFQTSGAVAIQSFSVETRTFLAVANSVDPDGSLAGGSIDIYEFDGGSLTLQQKLVSLPGVTALSNFYVNDAQWLAVSSNPVGDPSLILLSWDVSNCSETFLCSVNFTVFEELPIDDCRSVVQFRVESNNYLVYGGSHGLDIVSFQSSAKLTGTTTAFTVNGIATFKDLTLDLAQTDYVLSYESPGLFTAIGASFAVATGPGTSLSFQQSPSGALGGTALATQPVVVLVDAGGNVLTDATGFDVSATLSSSGQSSSLRGLSSVAILDGVATFTDLAVTTATWNFITFSAPTYSTADVNITVEVGSSYQLALQSGSADAYGGVAFGSQPLLWVVDRGGNLVSTDSSTQVAVSLHERSVFSFESASSAGILTAIVSDTAFFLRDGVGYVATASGNDAVIYKWGCTGPVPDQTIVSSGADVVGLFNYDEVLWLLIADSASPVQIYTYTTNFTWQNSTSLGEVDALLPILIGDSQYIAVARSTGTALYSWTKPAGAATGTPHDPILTLVQNVSTVGATVLEHVTLDDRETLLELDASGAVQLYIWDSVSMSFEAGAVSPPGSWTAMDVFYLASGDPHVALLSDSTGSSEWVAYDLTDHSSNSYSFTPGAGPCSVEHALKGSTYLVAFACSNTLDVYAGDGTIAGYSQILSSATSSSSISFLVSDGQTYLVAFGGSPGASLVWRVGGSGSLHGATLATASAGVVAFTDLAIDLVSSYDLSFAPETLYPQYPNSQEYILSQAYDLNFIVSLGIPDGLAQASEVAVGTSPIVRVVDAGGNSLTDAVSVTGVLDRPANYNIIQDVTQISSTGARDAEYFKIDGKHYVAIANNFDGTTFNVDSIVFEFSGGAFSSYQSLETRGAYDFKAFSIAAQAVTASGPQSKNLTHYLAVANHYHNTDGYLTDSVIYRWDATLATFEVFQPISTLGATSWEAFEVNGVTYLAVSNFFDGTFHACNSAVYRYSKANDKFELHQEIATVAAHDVTYVQHGGRHYLAFAQYRDEDEISLSLTSPLYRLNERSMQFIKVLEFDSSAAMHVEAFYIGSSSFLAVANYANATTGALAVNSAIYQLDCDGDTDVLNSTQAISTNGASHWRYFSRGGNHFLAVCHWVPDDLDANYVVVYLYDSGSFNFYTNTTSLGAFTVEFMFADNGYYLINTVPGDPVSEIKRFVDAGGAVQSAVSVSTVGGEANFAAFNTEINGYSYDGSILQSVGLDFESDGLQGTDMGPYGV